MTRKALRRRDAGIEEKLEQALADTFPASDPIAVSVPPPAKSSKRKLPNTEIRKEKDRS